jgi:hypothetical protein
LKVVSPSGLFGWTKVDSLRCQCPECFLYIQIQRESTLWFLGGLLAQWLKKGHTKVRKRKSIGKYEGILTTRRSYGGSIQVECFLPPDEVLQGEHKTTVCDGVTCHPITYSIPAWVYSGWLPVARNVASHTLFMATPQPPTSHVPDTQVSTSESQSTSPEETTDTQRQPSPPSHSGSLEDTGAQRPECGHRIILTYSRQQLLQIQSSPLVQPPEGMPSLKDWFG